MRQKVVKGRAEPQGHAVVKGHTAVQLFTKANVSLPDRRVA